MALMCPGSGCKEKKGPCMHEIVMIVAVIAVATYFVAFT
tara:strand:- start:19700 stop:19816 length:117 start_codon:yes stop_codon:yes gene_type:complete